MVGNEWESNRDVRLDTSVGTSARDGTDRRPSPIGFSPRWFIIESIGLGVPKRHNNAPQI